jgi:dolichyl-phosphate beta-glucosyltransferase
MTLAVIVVPCYNEFNRLPVDSFKSHSSPGGVHRFLFVDDGSTDATLQLLEELHAFDENTFKILRLNRNCGKAEAVRRGFLAALEERPDYIGYWDADLATPLDLITDFCQTLDQSPDLEIVMGARVILLGHDVDRHLVRHYLGRLSATAASFAVGIRVYDVMCGAKCFRVTPRTVSLFSHPFCSRWIFDVEWLARFVHFREGKTDQPIRKSICELPLRKWQEVPGSKIRWYDFPVALFELARIFLRYRCGNQVSLSTTDPPPISYFSGGERSEDAMACDAHSKSPSECGATTAANIAH